jgi:MFS superfamily sulfate permease-like transporter
VRFARKKTTPEVRVSWLAGMLLFIGVGVYALDRGMSLFVLPAWAVREAGPSVFGALGDHLPTLVHPFAFVLITAAALWPWPRLLPHICAAWFALEFAFEFGFGTFDPLDVLSIALGIVLAYLVVAAFRQENPHETT